MPDQGISGSSRFWGLVLCMRYERALIFPLLGVIAGCGAAVSAIGNGTSAPAAVVVEEAESGSAASAYMPERIIEAAPTTTTPAPTITGAPTTTQAPATTAAAPEVAVVAAPAQRIPNAVPAATIPVPAVNEFAPVTSPNEGDHCITDLEPATLNEFWSGQIGSFQGGDYQRAHHLGDGRILWTFQDAFINGRLIHNTAFVQSGTCFTRLSTGNWLFADDTSTMRSWFWIFDGGLAADGTFHLYVANMVERGGHYLANSEPAAMYRVVLDVATLNVLDVINEPIFGLDLYGWSVTTDGEFTYLLSNCYRQFGYNSPFGFDECVTNTKIARVPAGDFAADRTYWDGTNWVADPATAANITDELFIVPTGYGPMPSTNNPVQVKFDGDKFRMVSMPGDWWGDRVFTATADSIEGPWTITSEQTITPKCDDSRIAGGCNTYYASWVPWTDNGQFIYSVGNNTWDGSKTHSNLWVYRPTVHVAD